MSESILSKAVILNRVVFRGFALGYLLSILCLLLPPSSIAQTSNDTEINDTEANNAETIESQSEAAPEPTIEQTTEWSEATVITESFLQGCTGEESATLAETRTKQDFCQCAFSAYSKRYSPYQFIQINTLASQIGESGVSLVNLMMTNDMEACSEETGFELEP